MKYCKLCVQNDLRPGIRFTDGICSACNQPPVDWPAREQEFQQIIAEAKAKKAPFDCVIGVSGGKDTTFQALYMKDKLNCLLVNCEPDNISEVGRKNKENLIQHGFDCISIRPNPIRERQLSLEYFKTHGNFVKPLEYSLYSSAFIIADKFNIPLVVQGENAAITLGITDLKATGDAMDWKNSNTVKDWPLKDYFYQWPNYKGKAIYLQYYAKEWGYWRNTEYSRFEGLRSRKDHESGRTGKLNAFTSLDSDLKLVNQHLKYLKFGFGGITDEMCYAIREEGYTRQEAVASVKKYDGKISPHYIHEWCDYIGITYNEFWQIADKFVNKELFKKDRHGKWQPTFEVK